MVYLPKLNEYWFLQSDYRLLNIMIYDNYIQQIQCDDFLGLWQVNCMGTCQSMDAYK